MVKKLKKGRKNYYGFSMLEVMISVSIFTVVIFAVTATYARTFSAGQKSRIVQRNMEASRTAMEAMAKNMRMSTKLMVDATKKTVIMFNNSQATCIRYSFTGGSLTSLFYPSDPAYSPGDLEYPDCSTASGTPTELISADVDGIFEVTPTSATPKVVGKATVLLNIGNGVDAQHIQTSISFRDFDYE
ncbi:MAG: prepilin-type N-terminal cleavage/methylation domain-containing protein [Parcubacteria group bacterium]|jgi:prepilin-type N-terminal cleavage/methylation domain-containing protein